MDQDARPVARVFLAAAGATVLHVLQDRQRVAHGLVVLVALDVGYETDATGVVLEVRVVQALLTHFQRVVR